MPPTPPSTSSSVGHSPHSPPDTQFRVVRKRNRVPLSCGPCRNRKLKCNRGHPCDNCTKRTDAASCTYVTPGTRKKSATAAGSNNSPDEMQNRIDRLEGLVLSLITNGSQSAGPQSAGSAAAAMNLSASVSDGSVEQAIDLAAPESIREEDGDESEVDQVAKSIGVMKIRNNRAIFASEAHWYAILGELSEVKNYFRTHQHQYDEQLRKYKESRKNEGQPGTAFLFGAQKPTNHAEVLAQFPPKSTTDLLVARYFNTYDPGIHVIHGPTFQKQYDQHWLHPEETPVIWLGLVFAMMCIALQSYHRASDEPPEYRGRSWDISSEYRTLTAQCINLADVTTPVLNMIETLILHIYGDYARSRDAEVGILLSTGVLVRCAMRMGLHRDSQPYSGISIFQGEMRRRTWAAIRSLDLLFAAQAGLPPIVRPRDTNTEVPRNIFDDELWEGMEALPPSRSEDEVTPTLYLINRTRMIYMLGEAVELAQSTTCAGYDEIVGLDEQARELHAKTSPNLRFRSMDESARDPSTLIMQRFNLDLLFLKTICVLHRKFLTLSRCNTRFAYSRKACIDASMRMLEHQATLHRECQPGGRLRNVKWFISSLTTVDFLLAAMIVCSDVYHSARLEHRGRMPPGYSAEWGPDRRDEVLNALDTAIAIWEGLKDQSMEAYKAHALLSIMLEQLKQHRANQMQQGMAAYAPTMAMDDANVAPEHSAAMTLGMLSSGGLATNSANMFDTRYPAPMNNMLGEPVAQPAALPTNFGVSGPDQSGPQNAASPFSSLFAGSMGIQSMGLPSTNIDWDAWDSYIQGPPTIDGANQFLPLDMGGSAAPPPPMSAPKAPTQGSAQNAQGTSALATPFAASGMYIGSQSESTSSNDAYAMGFLIPKAA